MIQIIFLRLLIEIPADLAQLVHRAVRGRDYQQASRGLYWCAGILLIIAVGMLCAAIGSLRNS